VSKKLHSYTHLSGLASRVHPANGGTSHHPGGGEDERLKAKLRKILYDISQVGEIFSPRTKDAVKRVLIVKLYGQYGIIRCAYFS
jgi:hypothetical protein